MFPDKPGGLSVYAREGWRKYFSFAGPIAVFGYWFAWSSVLAVYGSLIGFLIVGEFFADTSAATWSWNMPVTDWVITAPRLIALGVILACWTFNILGMRPAVWFSYVTGAAMLLPVCVLTFGAFITGDFNNFAVGDNILGGTLDAYGYGDSSFNKFALIMVWLYIIGWSTYGPEAPRRSRPSSRTRRTTHARRSSAWARSTSSSLVCSPSPWSGRLAMTGHPRRPHGRHLPRRGPPCGRRRVVRHLPRGLPLRGSGALHEHGHDGRLAGALRLGRGEDDRPVAEPPERAVRARPAMTVDMLLNMFMVLAFPTLFFIIATGNLGYMLSHVLALSEWSSSCRPARLAAADQAS